MGKSTDYTSDEPYIPEDESILEETHPRSQYVDYQRGKEGAHGGGLYHSRRLHTGYIGYGKKDCWDNFMDVVEGRKPSRGEGEISDAAKAEILRCKRELEETGDVNEGVLRNMVLMGLLDQAESGRPQVRGNALKLLGETIGAFKKVSVTVGDKRALDELRAMERRLAAATPRLVEANPTTQDVEDFDTLPPASGGSNV